MVLLWTELVRVCKPSALTLMTAVRLTRLHLLCLFPARAAVLSISGGISPALAGLCLVYALDMTVSDHTEVSGPATFCGALRLPHSCRTLHV